MGSVDAWKRVEFGLFVCLVFVLVLLSSRSAWLYSRWCGGVVGCHLTVVSYPILTYATVDTFVSWPFDVVRISSYLSQIKYRLEGIFSVLIPEYRRKRFRQVVPVQHTTSKSPIIISRRFFQMPVGSDICVEQKIELCFPENLLPKISGFSNHGGGRRAFVLGPNG